MFRCNQNQGFKITFANGITVSVQFGPDNACKARGSESNPQELREWKSETAEVAVWDQLGMDYHPDTLKPIRPETLHETHKQNCTPAELLDILNRAQRITP